ncbi:MAG: cellulase family glycosylhydrolase, partial [Lentisphaerae bacterium]|nr:cellulase family glycosylhydrolase [Lentisphaerota bacterium]MBT7844311.1 cellulase family glycosylhydrolase [Lentisphaerota bacterium]
MMERMYLMAMAGPAMLALQATGGPLSLHPDNPHYFLFRGEPLILITSAEHYGAVLNLDFDYERYLETLARDGMNHTRTFVGAYCEPVGAFRIQRNTLAPAAGRFIAPWARSNQDGYANGGNRFDLKRWDPSYFERLRGFVAKAGELGIVVEVNLFCPFYRDEMWELSPMNARNNVNGIGNVPRERAYALDGEKGLLGVQEQMTRKVVSELKDCDNVFYETMNEPYQRAVPLDWELRIAQVVRETEAALGVKHLMSRNVANGKARVHNPHPEFSILNFHYAWPPDAVTMNYGLARLIGDNETGFKGNGDFHYRREGWAFILAGGGLYNNLDYSFTVGHEDGTFEYPTTQPGGQCRQPKRPGGATASDPFAVHDVTVLRWCFFPRKAASRPAFGESFT